MARTAQLDLPLVMPAQAQKHVTVNEALTRLDAVAQLRVVSSVEPEPPAAAADGASYLVPNGATGAWTGMAGRIAVRCNGGWVFLVPRAGWRAWDESRNGHQAFDGSAWVPDAVVVSQHGAGTTWQVVEFDHAITAGSTNVTGVSIPAQAQVVGVTGRVVSGLSGPGLIGWRIGVSGSDNRYGAGLGIQLNSYLVGLSGTPVTYYASTPLLLSAEGGSFTGGTLRLALHLVGLQPPRTV
jgi:uncharacterized protein DUF2793